MSFPLSDQPVFGEWFIFVDVQGHTYNKSFEVQKYGEHHFKEKKKNPKALITTTKKSRMSKYCSAFLTVIPKFELTIDPPRYIRDLNTCEQATVRAR